MRWRRSKRAWRAARAAADGAVRHHHAGRAAAARADDAGARQPRADDAAMHGFVLMLDNITRQFEDDSARDQLLHGLTEGSRASLGNLQAAVEMLDDAEMDTAMRERFQAVIRDEARAMSRRIQDLAAAQHAGPEHALAAGGHARRRPGVGRAAPHRNAARAARARRRGRRHAVAAGGQLLAAAGAGQPGGAAGRRVRHQAGRAAPEPRPGSAPTSTWCGPARR